MFISFLGIGQAGSNISDEWTKRGHYSAAMNFSKQDLESLEHIEKKLQLIGSEGIGKQRSNAIKLMENNWDLALNFVKENFSHSTIEIIFVPFATGGGSGSGVTPILLQLLSESMPDKVFVAMPILPSKDESYISQRNCLETFEDLSTLDICIVPIDNDKCISTLSNIGKNQLFNKINSSVVTLIEQLEMYTNKHSKYGVLDKKDLRSIFSVKGLATIAETELMGGLNHVNISETYVAEMVKKSWSETIFADIENNQILCSGLVYDGQDALMNFIDPQKIFNYFENKMPISLYEGYYNREKGGRVITVLSGLPWCNKRLQEIDEIIMETNTMLQDKKQSPVYKSKTLEMPFPISKNETKKVNDISDLIKKFRR